ncbi:MAG: ADP-ribosylglycohydrolase family protein [Gemmatimonadales bacterium]
MTGHRLPTDPTRAERCEGFLVGAVLGSALAARTADLTDPQAIRERLGAALPPAPTPLPDGTRRAATALADALLEQLVAGGVDLRQLTRRWVDWRAAEGTDVDPLLARAFDHLRDFDAPIESLPRPGIAPLAAALPAALASSSPQAMIAGAFHVARLLDPSEESALATVAVVVAASRFLEGSRDFLPDVIAVLRANDAPTALLDAVRLIPRDPGTPPPTPLGETPSPTVALTWLLWTAHHRPRALDVLTTMTLHGGISSTIGAVLGALLGARDGLTIWPATWLEAGAEEITLRAALARRISAS